MYVCMYSERERVSEWLLRYLPVMIITRSVKTYVRRTGEK